MNPADDQDALASAPPSDQTSGERSDLMDPEVRDRLMVLLAALGREWPAMRFGQLICALASSANSAVPDSVYDIEDVELLAATEQQLAYNRANR